MHVRNTVRFIETRAGRLHMTGRVQCDLHDCGIECLRGGQAEERRAAARHYESPAPQRLEDQLLPSSRRNEKPIHAFPSILSARTPRRGGPYAWCIVALARSE